MRIMSQCEYLSLNIDDASECLHAWVSTNRDSVDSEGIDLNALVSLAPHC